jgi:hypothetical protein
MSFTDFRNQVIELEIPEEVKVLCKEYADGLDKNRHYGRKVGKLNDLYRSCLGQEMVHVWLDRDKIYHDYMKPYHKEGRPLGEYDVMIAGETYDVKCRSRWNEKYSHNIELIMSSHEQEERLKVDYYIFCTTDDFADNVYILGALSYSDLWEKLHEPKERQYSFPPAGYIISRELKPIRKVIYRV